MKSIQAICLMLAFIVAGSIQAQESTETLTKQMSFDTNGSENLLNVYNIEGSIKIESYSGSVVDITAEKRIRAKNNKDLERGKSEIGMKVEKHGNTIVVYLRSPNLEYNPKAGKFKHDGDWGDDKYHSSLDFTIKVPQGTNLKLSTINDGDIVVQDVQANSIRANNINGGITMENVSGKLQVNALNRDINISLASNPHEDCTFDTLNGDVNLTVQKNPNADVKFKSLNGDIYTNLATTYLPAETKANKSHGKHGTKYKIDNNTKFRLGNGGPQWTFNLLNGDVTIKE